MLLWYAMLKLDLAGAHTLTLEVDYGKNQDVQARLNWIEPAMVADGHKGE